MYQLGWTSGIGAGVTHDVLGPRKSQKPQEDLRVKDVG